MPRPWLGGDRYGSHPRASYGKVQRTGQDAARCEPGVRTRDSGKRMVLGMTERLRAASIAALMSVAFSALLAGCAGSPPPDGKGPRSESMSADQFGQTDFNRTVTLEVRDNLASLYVLLDKLYRRNPANGARPTPPISPPPWRASSAPSRAPPPPAGCPACATSRSWPSRWTPTTGDRVAAFIYGLADTIIAAHNGKTWLYVSDALDGQRVYNAARNVEAAAWLLASRHNSQGEPLLLANEMSQNATNLSFEREFGAIIGRLDLIANLLGENSRRIGINYAQGLLLFTSPAGAVGRGAQSSMPSAFHRTTAAQAPTGPFTVIDIAPSRPPARTCAARCSRPRSRCRARCPTSSGPRSG